MKTSSISSQTLEALQRRAQEIAALEGHQASFIMDYDLSGHLWVAVLGGKPENAPLRALMRGSGEARVVLAQHIARDLFLSLSCTHNQGVVHDDLRPETILIGGRAGWMGAFPWERGVYLTEFGIDRILGESAKGGQAYLAPERLSGAPPSRRSDIYSAALVLHELLSGCRPKPGATPGSLLELAPLVPIEAASLLHRALVANPRRRPGDAEEWAEALRWAFFYEDEADIPAWTTVVS